MTMTTKLEKVNSSNPTVYSYTRWSSKPQSRGDSERRQLEAAQNWCSQRSLTLSATEVDDGISAKAGKNRVADSGLSRLLSRVRPGDYLLVEDNDRLSREDWLTASNFIHDITSKGVTIVTLQNGNEITADKFRRDPGCFLPSVLRSFTGNDENVKKSLRVKAAWVTKRQEIKEGKAIRQKLPGWFSHEKSFMGGKTILGKIVVDETKAATVREIFRLTLAGWGSRRIAKHFNATKVPSVSGQSPHWNGYSLLATIIRNPAVMGDYRVIENKKPTGEVIKGIFPPVVDEKTFYAANAAATGHRKLTTPAEAITSNIATGLVRCPTCGGNMSRHRNHAHGKVYSCLISGRSKAGTNTTDCACRPSYDAFEAGLLALMRDSATLRQALGQSTQRADRIERATGQGGRRRPQAQ
jgi:DNA invertase Pin-like site-specific DNA recombinase